MRFCARTRWSVRARRIRSFNVHCVTVINTTGGTKIDMNCGGVTVFLFDPHNDLNFVSAEWCRRPWFFG